MERPGTSAAASALPVVAIVGRPNVGKSTLFNRLVGERRAVVGGEPGITRDRNYARVTLGPRDLVVVDTGGIEPSDPDPLLRDTARQARAAVEEADRILFVLDAKQGLTPADQEIHALLRSRGKEVLCVVNKVDGPRDHAALYEFYRLGVETLFPVSAEHGPGVEALVEALLHGLPPAPPVPDQPDDAIRVSVIGRPNVGKSTLINRLLGEERLVTSPAPGTTRDAVDTVLVRRGCTYVLVDTAGLRRRSRVGPGAEAWAVIRALRAVERSQVCLIVLDAAEGVTDQDKKIAALAHGAARASLVAANKWDTLDPAPPGRAWLRDLDRSLPFLDYAPRLAVSARTGMGVGRILPRVEALFRTYRRRASTAQVNRVLAEAVRAHEPPRIRGRRVRILYGTQAGTAPPTFVLFASAPAALPQSYRRYLAGRLRAGLGLEDVPVRIFFKKKS